MLERGEGRLGGVDDPPDPDPRGVESLLDLGDQQLDGEADQQPQRLFLGGKRGHHQGIDPQVLHPEGHQALERPAQDLLALARLLRQLGELEEVSRSQVSGSTRDAPSIGPVSEATKSAT